VDRQLVGMEGLTKAASVLKGKMQALTGVQQENPILNKGRITLIR